MYPEFFRWCATIWLTVAAEWLSLALHEGWDDAGVRHPPKPSLDYDTAAAMTPLRGWRGLHAITRSPCGKLDGGVEGDDGVR